MVDIIKSLVTAFIGCIGFGLIFDVAKRHIAAASIGGALTFAIYLLGKRYGMDTFFASIFASAFATCYAEIMARVKKTPAITFLILGLIPLIPGSPLYYTMSNMVQKNTEMARYYGRETIFFAMGLAAGMSLIIAFRGIKYAPKTRK